MIRYGLKCATKCQCTESVFSNSGLLKPEDWKECPVEQTYDNKDDDTGWCIVGFIGEFLLTFFKSS